MSEEIARKGGPNRRVRAIENCMSWICGPNGGTVIWVIECHAETEVYIAAYIGSCVQEKTASTVGPVGHRRQIFAEKRAHRRRVIITAFHEDECICRGE